MQLLLEKDNMDTILSSISNLKDGDLLIFPTDTVYGLSVVIKNIKHFKKYIQKIYDIKNRDITKQMILLVSDKNKILDFVDENSINDGIKRVINEFLPGSISLILKSNQSVIDNIGYLDIGIRIPNNKELINVIDKLGGYLFTTSANISGDKSSIKFDEIPFEIIENSKICLKNDKIIKGIPSTIIKFENDTLKLIREGSIPFSKIRETYENNSK